MNETIYRDLVGVFGIPGAFVLVLAGLAIIKWLRNGGNNVGEDFNAFKLMIEPVISSITANTSALKELAQLIKETRHDYMIPMKMAVTDIQERSDNVEHMIHDFSEVKAQVADTNAKVNEIHSRRKR